MKYKRAIVTPDKHFPLHDVGAINVVKKAIEKVKPTIYVDLGDTAEASSFSRFRWKNRKKPPLEYLIPQFDAELKLVNEGMDSIDESLDKIDCKERHFCQGYHELWMDEVYNEHNYLPQYKTENALKLKERGYKFHRAGKYLKIGKLYFYHGHHYGGQYHTANHLRKLSANIVYGHHHGVQQMSATHIDGQKSAWSLGCLKDCSSEKNKWLGGRPVDWGHAFAIIDFFDKGKFTLDLIRIIDGKAMVWGELIDGNV